MFEAERLRWRLRRVLRLSRCGLIRGSNRESVKESRKGLSEYVEGEGY